MPQKYHRRLWFLLLLLMLLTPLGVWLPEVLHAEQVWGEWNVADLEKMMGRVPARLSALRDLWNGVLPNYRIAGLDRPLESRIVYLASAFLGTALIVAIATGLAKYWTSAEKGSLQRNAKTE